MRLVRVSERNPIQAGSFRFNLAVADNGFPFGQLGLQVGRERVLRAVDRRVSKRRQPIPHFRQTHDLTDLPLPEFDDVVRCSLRDQYPVPKSNLVVRYARLLQRGNAGKFCSPRLVGYDQQPKLAVAHQRRSEG